MGILSEVTVIRLCDGLTFQGHSWTGDDGTLEAFWKEGGNRLCHMFDCKGVQQGAWKMYRLELK